MKRTKERGAEIPSRDITPEGVYAKRRDFLRAGALAAVGGAGLLASQRAVAGSSLDQNSLGALSGVKPSGWKVAEPLTPWKDVASYNNFYEFGTGKGDPVQNAHTLKTRPWTVAFEGEIAKPQVLDIDTLVKMFPLEERVYRFRCVEAWSMVIPWAGFPLSELIKKLQPTSKAKYVAFTTLLAPDQMPGQRGGSIDYPYVEGLRMDEAMHPMTLLAAGLYGRVLPNQNGAPLRLVVPWKYGFKSIKSVVKIRFVEKEPPTTWNLQSSREYGFYSNVNPDVDHPRWSQSRERRIGEFLKRKTLPFNGYADQVAGLYKGMDLKTNF